MDINEHYKILELNLGATNEEIKAAYKRLAKNIIQIKTMIQVQKTNLKK